MKTRIKSILPVAVICLVAVLIELLFSNFVWISYVWGRDEVKDFVPSGFTQEIINEADNSFAVDGIDFPINSVSYTVRTADPEAEDTLLTAAYYVADEASTASAALVRSIRNHFSSVSLLWRNGHLPWYDSAYVGSVYDILAKKPLPRQKIPGKSEHRFKK